jgi:hypothetical protein
MVASAAVMGLWMAGAIYFDVAQTARWGKAAAFAWLAVVAALFIGWQPLWQPFAFVAASFILMAAWWLTLKPRLDREWDPSVAVLPRAVIDGDAVTVVNVRNNEYRSFDDYDARHETRTYNLSNLRGLDIIFFYWGSEWICHPVLIFDFGPDGRLCVSIEVRFRKGQKYAILRSFYRQQELIFLAVDERDAILRRTKHGEFNDAYFFELKTAPEEIRTVFLDYMAVINSMSTTPRWYHGLFSNCTTNFYRLPNSRFTCDWHILANGKLDRVLYRTGRFDTSLPFDELKRTGYLNPIVNGLPAEGFGDRYREEVRRRQREG